MAYVGDSSAVQAPPNVWKVSDVADAGFHVVREQSLLSFCSNANADSACAITQPLYPRCAQAPSSPKPRRSGVDAQRRGLDGTEHTRRKGEQFIGVVPGVR